MESSFGKAEFIFWIIRGVINVSSLTLIFNSQESFFLFIILFHSVNLNYIVTTDSKRVGNFLALFSMEGGKKCQPQAARSYHGTVFNLSLLYTTEDRHSIIKGHSNHFATFSDIADVKWLLQ